jgi:hypothetical protein
VLCCPPLAAPNPPVARALDMSNMDAALNAMDMKSAVAILTKAREDIEVLRDLEAAYRVGVKQAVDMAISAMDSGEYASAGLVLRMLEEARVDRAMMEPLVARARASHQMAAAVCLGCYSAAPTTKCLKCYAAKFCSESCKALSHHRTWCRSIKLIVHVHVHRASTGVCQMHAFIKTKTVENVLCALANYYQVPRASIYAMFQSSVMDETQTLEEAGVIKHSKIVIIEF